VGGGKQRDSLAPRYEWPMNSARNKLQQVSPPFICDERKHQRKVGWGTLDRVLRCFWFSGDWTCGGNAFSLRDVTIENGDDGCAEVEQMLFCGSS